MKYNRLLTICLALLLLASCKKEHYDVSNVNSVHTEGELLLPLTHTSFTVREMMERFEMDDEVDWTEDGGMSLRFDYEADSLLLGDDLLRFDDMYYEWRSSFENPFPVVLPATIDTVVSFQEQFSFQSEDIRVMQAEMKAGRFDFTVASNIGDVLNVVLHVPSIKDAQGNDFVLDAPVVGNTFGFDLDGLRYVTEEANMVSIIAEIRFSLTGSLDPELYYDFHLIGRNLAIREMRGYVDAYELDSRIDTAFSLFPGSLTGMTEVEGVRISVSERNTYGMDARLVVDTALLYCEGQSPVSLIEPMPIVIGIPSQMQFGEVYNQTISANVNMSGGRVYATTSFVVNPEGQSSIVAVTDTSRVDARIGVEIPFAFNLDNVVYMDTVSLNLSDVTMPDMIEKLTLDFGFASTLPMNLMASFYLYDSVAGRITDTLLSDAELIKASFDGQPVSTEVSLIVDEDAVESVMHSDHLIMSFLLDTDDKNIRLKGDQKVDVRLKAAVQYKANVEF